jgi:hypothetical protein
MPALLVPQSEIPGAANAAKPAASSSGGAGGAAVAAANEDPAAAKARLCALEMVSGALAWLGDRRTGGGAKLYRKMVQDGEDGKKCAQDVYVKELKLRMAALAAACVPELPDDCADAVRKTVENIEKKDIVRIAKWIDGFAPTEWLGRFTREVPKALGKAHLANTRSKLSALLTALGGMETMEKLGGEVSLGVLLPILVRAKAKGKIIADGLPLTTPIISAKLDLFKSTKKNNPKKRYAKPMEPSRGDFKGADAELAFWKAKSAYFEALQPSDWGYGYGQDWTLAIMDTGGGDSGSGGGRGGGSGGDSGGGSGGDGGGDVGGEITTVRSCSPGFHTGGQLPAAGAGKFTGLAPTRSNCGGEYGNQGQTAEAPSLSAQSFVNAFNMEIGAHRQKNLARTITNRDRCSSPEFFSTPEFYKNSCSTPGVKYRRQADLNALAGPHGPIPSSLRYPALVPATRGYIRNAW